MKGLGSLLSLFSLRYVARRRLRTALGLCAITLAVTLYVSSATSHAGIVASAERTARDLAGSAEWVVSRRADGPVDADVLRRIRAIPGAIAAPLVQATTTLKGGDPLLILGVDFLSDAMLRLYEVDAAPDVGAVARTAFKPGGILVSRRLAERRGLRVGSSLDVGTRGGPRALEVTGILEDVGPARVFSGGFAIMALPQAQRLFRAPDVLDRIEVGGGVPQDVLQRALPGCTIEPAGRVRAVVADAINRIRSFAAIGVIALLVGVFIVYNTVAISVVERTKVLGTLRAIGATGRQIRAWLLVEWLAIGAVGSVLGVIAGVALARVLVSYAASTIQSLMLVIDVQEVPIVPSVVVTGLLAGIVATFAAVWIPARQAMRTEPVEILRPRAFRLRGPPSGATAAGLVALGLWIVLTLAFGPHSLMSLVTTGLVFVAIALMLPALMARCAALLKRVAVRLGGVTGFIGFDNVNKFPARTALTATALAGTLAMMVAMATLVQGFAGAARRWMDEAFPFHLAVTASDLRATIYTSETLAPDTLDAMRAVPGAGIAYGVRTAFTPFEGHEVMLLGVDSEEFLQAHRQKGMSRWANALGDAALHARFRVGEVVHVSENFVWQFGRRSGDTITLATPSGEASFVIGSVIEDYSWPHGLIALDRARYRSLWKDDGLTYVDLRAAPGEDVAALKERVAERLTGDRRGFVYTVEEIKAVATDTLHQTLAFANVQVLIAIAIGFLGIVNTLLMSVLERTREIGLLRAIGMTGRQVGRTVAAEALVIATLGGVLGVVTGILGGLIPVRMYMLAVTGYLTPFAVPWGTVGGALLAAAAIGVVASILPARRAAGVDVVEAIGYE